MNWHEINRRWVRPAEEALRAGRSEEARRLFEEGLAATEGDGWVALRYGEMLEREGQLERSAELYDLAVRRLPKERYRKRAEAALERVRSRLAAEGDLTAGGNAEPRGAARTGPRGESERAWILQAHPEHFDLPGALRAGIRRLVWRVPQHREHLRRGDRIYLWVAGRHRGIVAEGRALSDPLPFEELEPGEWKEHARFDGPAAADETPPSHVVRIEITRAFPERRLTADRLQDHPVLRELPILKQPRGTVFPVPEELVDPLAELVRRQAAANEGSHGEMFAWIVTSLAENGLRFDPEQVASYLLALQTKRFVILTGISGTGKTRLAMELARLFPAVRRTSRPNAPGDDAVAVTVQPYMKKYARLVLPVSLWEGVTWPMPSGSGLLPVVLPWGELHLRVAHIPERNLAILLLRGEARRWIRDELEAGDTLLLRLETDDEGVARRLVVQRPELEERVERIRNWAVIAVRPDWTDHRGLLGHHNPLAGQYVVTPFLRLLLEAHEEVTIAEKEGREPAPFFAILDEMNLARVEHYFSDLLSAMESGEPIHLHDDPAVEEGEAGEPVPREVEVPPNLYVVGTVNVDETTYMFSPKVLDRAFTLELNRVDLAGYGAGGPPPGGPLALPGFDGLPGRWERPGRDDWRALCELEDGRYRDLLIRLNSLLEEEGRQFGYRVANEIARFVRLAHEQSGGEREATRAAFDLAVHAKVLPKLHGTQQELEQVLEQLFAFAIGHDAPQAWRRPDRWRVVAGRLEPAPPANVPTSHPADTGEPETETEAEAAASAPVPEPLLPRTAGKLLRMLRRLERQGFTSFIE